MQDDDITQWLSAAQAGDREALDRVHGLLYRELHVLARRQLGPHKDATLNTTTQETSHLCSSRLDNWRSEQQLAGDTEKFTTEKAEKVSASKLQDTSHVDSGCNGVSSAATRTSASAAAVVVVPGRRD